MAPSSSNQVTAPPPEVEATLSKLTAHKNVTGCLVLTRPEALIIRAGGRDFEPSGPGAHERSERLRRVVRMVKAAVEGLGASVGDVDEGVSTDQR
jgi:dynein light chain roadblock-type